MTSFLIEIHSILASEGTSSRTSEKLDTMTATTPQPFSVPVLFTEIDHEPKNIWTDYGPTERRIIAKGWVKEEGRKAFSVDTIWDKDVRIPLRDGVELLGDVFRPVTSDDKHVPAIMPWSHYGKTGTGIQQLDMFPWRVGVPRSETSGLEKWEAPDPAEWVTRGYAVVNIDARGSFKSGGDLVAYGTQEGRDGYDCIEWIAQQPWCNKRVSMAGNSWLGTTQWFIAAEQPPHLACMAPWEGLGDYYRESICRGGIPDHAFWSLLMAWTCGECFVCLFLSPKWCCLCELFLIVASFPQDPGSARMSARWWKSTVLGMTIGRTRSRSSATSLFQCMLPPASQPGYIPKDH